MVQDLTVGLTVGPVYSYRSQVEEFKKHQDQRNSAEGLKNLKKKHTRCISNTECVSSVGCGRSGSNVY